MIARVEQVLRSWSNKLDPVLNGPAVYALFGDGHRIRPKLCLAWCERTGGSIEHAVNCAAAVELVHTMSLIQDDLPCMDNALLRRGKPSVWDKYGERAAILVSDALLCGAFSLASNTPKAVSVLSRAAQRMAEGQESEAHGGDWRSVNDGKTGALFEAACELGVLCNHVDISGEGGHDLDRAKRFGRVLGEAYQLLDDAADGDGAAGVLGRDTAAMQGKELLSELRLIDPKIAEMVLEAMR